MQSPEANPEWEGKGSNSQKGRFWESSYTLLTWEKKVAYSSLPQQEPQEMLTLR